MSDEKIELPEKSNSNEKNLKNEIFPIPDMADITLSRLFCNHFQNIIIGETNELEQIRIHTSICALLEMLPTGMALLGSNQRIFWTNKKFCEIAKKKPARGENFYQVLDRPKIGGPIYSPFAVARTTKEPVVTRFENLHGSDYHFHVVPLFDSQKEVHGFLAVLEDITDLTKINHQLEALHDAAGGLVDLTPSELFDMSVEDRIELLKSNIVRFIDDILKVDVVEIRLLNLDTLELAPLLSIGMTPEAETRKLYASAKNNGVTGFVARLGKSYFIDDTRDDPIFLAGSQDAKSSITVPLKFHDQVIGTLNVESPIPRAFTEIDQLLIEVFARDVAFAIHTLDLLTAARIGTVAASVEAIHSEVALPIDQILADAVSLYERYIGLDITPEIGEKFERILNNARRIKTVIHRVGAMMTPGQAHPTPPKNPRPLLNQKRILVIDEDENVRRSAHELLASYGCIVETVPNGELALMLAKNAKYDVFIGAIKLPDMNGYEFMLKLIELTGIDPPPYIMMVGFGYDSNHTRVKANQRGLRAVLYKPFRLDQLLNTVEKIIYSKQQYCE
ncbi:MAG: response regulator [Planctomycetaceae bacterium]|jgi:CheY-like chemotaxis protein/GAF domain-containing protein|nr:response regulator [Planctomycetaceae bacterium]